MKTMRMKFNYLLSLSIAFSLVGMMSCTDEEPTIDEQISGTWKLTQVTGGTAGLDCLLSDADVSWTFQSPTISIVADNFSISLCPLIDNQDHTYSIIFLEETPFLIRDNEDFGQITITESTVDEQTIENLSIDGGILPSGQVEDGFIYSFTRDK